MKYILSLLLSVLLFSCHLDSDTQLTVTVEEIDGTPKSGVEVVLSPPDGSGSNQIDPYRGFTDNTGKVTLVLIEYANGSAYGVILSAQVFDNGTELSIQDGDNIIIKQTAGEYEGEDYTHTIVLK